MSNAPILIGITGNIGSGKSTFCSLLREAGYNVVAADEVAGRQLDDPQTLKKIARRWGTVVVSGGKPDRKKIAEIVFNSKTELDFLNHLVHPQTLIALQQIVDDSPEKYLFFEVPLLFEAGLQRCFDYIVLICADRARRLQRLTRKGKAKAEEIEARMDAQIDDLGKAPLCDLVIDNNGTLKTLKTRVTNFIANLEGIRQRDKIPFSI